MSEPADQPTATPTAPNSTEPPAFNMHGERLPSLDRSKLTPYDFRNPGFIGEADLRQLHTMYERFVQHLAARLSTYVRMECGLKLATFNNETFAKFCESLATPTHLTLFQVEPMRGVGIVDLHLPIGLALADRLLGGKGKASETNRGLTEIEVELLADAIQVVITEWTALWEDPSVEYHPQCIGHETSGRFLKTSPADAPFLVAAIDFTLGELTGKMHVGVPFSMIETVVKTMQAARQRGTTLSPKQIKWRAPFAGISVPVIAEWQVREIALGDVLRMQAGHVIQLPRELIAQTRVRLSNTEEFTGTVGMQNGQIAVQLGQRSLKN
jgi:flagellar motor switch protein FliM